MSADRLEQALALHRSGQLAQAAEAYESVLRIDPAHADAWHLSGLVAAQVGNEAEGRRRIERAIALQPARAIYLVNLGRLLRQTNCPADAITAFDRALVLDPRQPEVLVELAELMAARGELAAAIALTARAVTWQPDRRDWRIELAAYLLDAKRFDESASVLQEILDRNPGDADSIAALGQVRARQQRYDDAIALYERALAIQPDCRLAEDGLIASHTRLARTADALRVIDRVLARRPDDAVFRSRRLFLSNYLPDLSPAALAKEHSEWGRRLCQSVVQDSAINHRPAPSCAPKERLRIAYVSADFKRHSVSYFIEPVLAGHDRRRVEVFCYSSTHDPDDVTARLSSLADVWRDVRTLDDDALLNRIVADRIDVLIDLSGHTADHRLGVFARRAAAVQISWLGYPHSTGLPTMDYRICDAITDPPGAADALASERLLRLSGGFLCYRPAPSSPTCTDFLPPSSLGQALTFGSFNHVAKLNRDVVTVWAALLRELPSSRLYLKAPGIGAASTADRLRAEFSAAGIAADRLLLGGATPDQATHLAAYRQVDIALDPFPYNGTTTTFDALWMGVPVITLAGDRHAGRVGASLLSALGHPELVADNVEHYLALARQLAGDPARLAMLHQSLRDDLRRSPLMDEAGFVQKLEAAYFHAWQSVGE